nr:hypothetical protein [Hymenobacter sp. PAMC 26628]
MRPNLPKKFGVMGINLRESKMSDLQKLSNDFNEVDIEEMDTPKGCLGQDSRYVAGKGFYSKNYKGLIFQKDQNSEYIGKIRLTKEFEGELPDGKHIIAKDLLDILTSDNQAIANFVLKLANPAQIAIASSSFRLSFKRFSIRKLKKAFILAMACSTRTRPLAKSVFICRC